MEVLLVGDLDRPDNGQRGTGMVADVCKARVHVDHKNPIKLIRSFEPVP
ncbi:hypothetical protein MELA_01460 [Candidatus Methylomirabilis lanthanidiphila]|uniref:Uncharacterized protein n=1 Tax=Candidatus Methylomirabilis lanthanidiphila TaxID=2211376 RepID=A0A564ZIF6_9BACT|nr:hypothetical protein [Candidatus Methylomirabilis lanthanidiphila]VUZ85084.1 hypothetical protein MELA_01460 [Candidatus Methylomirabilis lanthanidiphila]